MTRNDATTVDLTGFQQFETLKQARSFIAHLLRTVVSV